MTHAALIADVATTTKRHPKRRARRNFAPCRRRCPGGHVCGLNANVPHLLCICESAECACHGAQRYVLARKGGR